MNIGKTKIFTCIIAILFLVQTFGAGIIFAAPADPPTAQLPNTAGNTSIITGTISHPWGGSGDATYDPATKTYTGSSNLVSTLSLNLAPGIRADAIHEFTINMNAAEEWVGGWYQYVFYGTKDNLNDFVMLRVRRGGGHIYLVSRIAGVWKSRETGSPPDAIGGEYELGSISGHTSLDQGTQINLKLYIKDNTIYVFRDGTEVYRQAFPEITLGVTTCGIMSFAGVANAVFSNIAVYEDLVMLPDLSEKENLMVAQFDGEITSNEILGTPGSGNMQEGVFVASTQNGVFEIPTKLSTPGYELFDKTTQEPVAVSDLTVITSIEMYPNASSTHTLNFSPRFDAPGLIFISIGTNLSGMAHHYNVFTEMRSDGGNFTRGNMIADIRTLIPSFSLTNTDGSQRVRLITMTKGTSLSAWLSYSSDSGSSWTDNVLILNNVSMPSEMNFRYAPCSLHGGSGTYTGFAVYTLENIEVKANDELLKLNLSKSAEGEFIITLGIKGGQFPIWRDMFSYQIWTYQDVESDIFETSNKNKMWILSRGYTAPSGFIHSDGNMMMNIGSEFISEDGRYKVAVKVINQRGEFVRQLHQVFTREDLNEVVIEKVEVDGKFADEKTIVKEIREDGTVGIEVFTNDVTGVTYKATVQPVNTTLTSSAVNNKFEWDISGLAPGRYTLTLEVSNGNGNTDSLTINFNLFNVLLPSGGYASFGTQRPVVTGNNNEFTFNANTPSGNPSGMQYRYTLSEPWSTTLKNQSSTSDSQTLYLDVNQYGIYHAITRLYRPDSSTVDDGAIVTVNFDRPGIGDLTLNAGHEGGEVTKGTQITINPTVEGTTSLPGVQYSFWRRDATGWRRIRDYAEGGITWTPARIGDYTIQVRAKGEGAGSYELVRNIEFNITDGNENKLTVNGEITLNWSDNPTARRPVTLTANAVNPSSGDVLYKFIISDGYLFYIETGYSSDPTYTFVAGSAREYSVSVLVKNQTSFGKFDASRNFKIMVN